MLAALWIVGFALAVVLQSGDAYIRASRRLIVAPLTATLHFLRRVLRRLVGMVVSVLRAAVLWITRWLYDRIRHW